MAVWKLSINQAKYYQIYTDSIFNIMLLNNICLKLDKAELSNTCHSCFIYELTFGSALQHILMLHTQGNINKLDPELSQQQQQNERILI